MAKDLSKALDNLELTYNNVIDIANSILEPIISPVNVLVETIGDDINSLSLDELKDYMWKLQHSAYGLTEIKEKSQLKAELATALQKEKAAQKFMEADGAQGAKQSIALIETSEEIVVEALYESIASQLKNKVDQVQRLVNVIQSILMARMQELKITNNSIQ